ncbi:hypothetical protein P872_11100 [Rhodonellum psychrophilum GCM71 = DSM 17998]|uniref:Uncharacterized protein n=2 Tax=Rhodonellum TaxID=336827 RepID=U5BSR0_9BACT|nr:MULTISPECIES: hypothetical protein [Rhodonellum]ERM80918.1 hypothetical protein P872_11100 [Rhodonellum psychrophilum GCM71 = DSM 17998]SDZ56984.1 hypothetical protein SAMN05444412_12718 [Rhodonellum ikkaensis]
MNITSTIEKYLNTIIKDEFHRYKSWDNCHQAFNVDGQTQIHTLELAFYLASWGMYRGSSGLLQKNHLIHKGAVGILFSKEARELKCDQNNDVNRNDIKEIMLLKDKLADHYRKIYFTKGAAKPKAISPTDTLLSKILLGSLGCIPAYDRYFIDGLKELKMKHTVFNINSLSELFDFLDNNKTEIETAQKLVSTKTNKHYPIMKILDMYFWQIGYDKEVKEKQQKIKQFIKNDSEAQ